MDAELLQEAYTNHLNISYTLEEKTSFAQDVSNPLVISLVIWVLVTNAPT